MPDIWRDTVGYWLVPLINTRFIHNLEMNLNPHIIKMEFSCNNKNKYNNKRVHKEHVLPA